MKFRDRMIRFLSGRNGPDALYRFQLILYVLLILIQMFVSGAARVVLYALSLLMLVWLIFRLFSRNLPRRRAENAKYLALREPVFQFFRRQRNRVRDRKTHVYRRCPKCRTWLRLPRRSGTHRLDCPRCGAEMTVKIRH